MSTRKGQAASVTLLRREQLRSASAPTFTAGSAADIWWSIVPVHCDVGRTITHHHVVLSVDGLGVHHAVLDVGQNFLIPVSYTHLRAHETGRNLVCRLLLEKKKKKKTNTINRYTVYIEL